MKLYKEWCLLLFFVLCSCTTAPISRIEQFRDIYDKWPLEVRQAVLNGRVIPGMTIEMVYLAWGQPTKVTMYPIADEQVWLYEDEGFDGRINSRKIVIFRDGIIANADIQK